MIGFHRVDGEFRADDFAIVAIHAIIRLKGFGWMVAFLVKTVGKGKDTPGAKFDTITTPFAVLDIQNDFESPGVTIQTAIRFSGDLIFWNSSRS